MLYFLSYFKAGPIDSLLLQRESVGTVNTSDLKMADHRPLSLMNHPSSSDKVLDPEPQTTDAIAGDVVHDFQQFHRVSLLSRH